MLGFYDYTMWLTYISELSAIVSMFLAISGHPTGAIGFLLGSGLCDMFDGAVARTKKDRTDTQKKYGIQIDSLADVVAFGAAPAVISYTLGMNTWYYCIILAWLALAALIRLAYFNVTEEERQKQTTEKRKFYEGLPVPASAVAVPLVYCFRNVLGERFFVPVLAIMLAIVGFCYVGTFHVKKWNKKELIAIVFIGIALFVFSLLGLGK